MQKDIYNHTTDKKGLTQSWIKDLLIMAFVGLLISSYFLVLNVCTVGDSSEFQDSYTGNIVFSASISMFLYGLFRIMFRYLNEHFPWQKSIGSRIILQLILIIVVSIIGMTVFMYVWSGLFSSASYSHTQYISNNVIAVIVSLILNALYEGVNLYRQLKDSQVFAEQLKRQNIESHFETLKNQVGPHFLFNSLNTLLVLIDEDVVQARIFVEKLSAYYRYTLQVNEKATVELNTEIELLTNYIFLLKCRFGENLILEINLPSDILQKHIIPLSIQMLVENAVKHNVISGQKPLTIKIYSENSFLVVENNLQQRDSLNSSNGIGLVNIRNRYEIVSLKTIRIEKSDSFFKVLLPLI
jgi:two-component system, LytTR family, sensor kinase